MLRIIVADDLLTQSSRGGAILPQLHASPGITPIPVQLQVSPAFTHPLGVVDALAKNACKPAGDGSAVLVNLNLVIGSSRGQAIRRQDRGGLMIVEALRRNHSLQLPVYGCSFESACALTRCKSFGALFVDFADCNRFLRLPISNCDFTLPRPDERRLQALAEVLRSRQQDRRASETVATLRGLLSRFAHNQRTDLTALVGPVKAALRAGCYDLVARPQATEGVRDFLDQLRAEANSLAIESSVKGAVLDEIGRLESLWETAAEAIDRIRSFSGSPERPWSSTSEQTLEKIATFEERILELQRG